MWEIFCEWVFCVYVICGIVFFVVRDVIVDLVFLFNLLVIGLLYICFYVGMFLFDCFGFVFGILCVFDVVLCELSMEDFVIFYDLGEFCVYIIMVDCVKDEYEGVMYLLVGGVDVVISGMV